MTEPSQPLLDIVLMPSRSLPPMGFHIMMGVLAALSVAVGVFFVRHHAWPVFGFFGLDVLALYIAFRVNYRAGGLREHVRLSPDALDITRRQPDGHEQHWAFNPLWVKVRLHNAADHNSRVELSSHGKRLTLGAFLPPAERGEVAGMLAKSLAELRHSGVGAPP